MVMRVAVHNIWTASGLGLQAKSTRKIKFVAVTEETTHGFSVVFTLPITARMTKNLAIEVATAGITDVSTTLK